MTSPSAIQFGQYYHIYNRGNNLENIFREERNYEYFLNRYKQRVTPIAETYVYCLLKNHFHLLVRIKHQDEVSTTWQNKKPGQVFGNFFNAYAKAFNRLYQRNGSLFQNPFGRVKVTSDKQLFQLVIYIHQNPERHGFVDDFRDWPYSSYHVLKSSQPTWLNRDEVLDWFGSPIILEDAHDTKVHENEVKNLVPEEFD
jgi:REP element-mobilizing transposase RayT